MLFSVLVKYYQLLIIGMPFNRSFLFLDFCCCLPKLGMYISQWDDSGCNEVNCVPTSITDAQMVRQSLKELLDDIDITSKVR